MASLRPLLALLLAALLSGCAATSVFNPYPMQAQKFRLALNSPDTEAVLAEFGGQGFGAFKPALGELLVETLAPIGARFRELKEDREALDAILARGALRARELGRPTLDAAYRALGLVRG